MKHPVTIVLVGGGSGGHITPILSVAQEIKAQRPDWRLVHIGQKGDVMSGISQSHSSIDAVRTIRAGKLRRYNGVSKIRQVLDIKTQFLNFRDLFYLEVGTIQAIWQLARLKPAAVFLKGGYVGVPVAWAARLLRIPYVTHDSDSLAGLANRMVSRHAAWHATGMPVELYDYPLDKTTYTGVPIDKHYHLVGSAGLGAAKAALSLDPQQKVILVIGGGLGAKKLNDLMISASKSIVTANPDATIFHLSGHKLYNEVIAGYHAHLGEGIKQIVVIAYSQEVYRFSAAADLIVTRAGATTLAEFASQGKPCIVVPNPELTGGHQLKNSQSLAHSGAIIEFQQEKTAEELAGIVNTLLAETVRREELARRFNATAKTDAARQLSNILIKVVEQGR